MEFNADALAPLKVATICVLTTDLLQSSDPAAENYIAADMKRAIAETLDASFIDPANAGVAGEEPASVTNGVTPIAGSDSAERDLLALIASFTGDLRTAFFIMQPFAGAAASSSANPNIGARGGEWRGVPVIVSNSVPSGVIALVDAAGIGVGEGDASLATATSAALQMDDAPTADALVPTATSVLSLFQVNAVALRAERTINWQAMVPGSVSFVEGASWSIGLEQT